MTPQNFAEPQKVPFVPPRTHWGKKPMGNTPGNYPQRGENPFTKQRGSKKGLLQRNTKKWAQHPRAKGRIIRRTLSFRTLKKEAQQL